MNNFTESGLQTVFGDFTIRVYPNQIGQETVVLFTPNLDSSKPVLVRVHSECLTGDTFGSLRCDCGPQLRKALKILSSEGGVLIYLRQEGRGIGLFEKIKSYQLQAQGHDTFDANLLLGHRPDQRSYEMVGVVLRDLNISEIRLLTNNPSKITDIAKLGIRILERMPLIVPSNKENKNYIKTKVEKFQHLKKSTPRRYFYQFHVDSASQVESIASFLQGKMNDPFLEICVGFTVDDAFLNIAEQSLIVASCLSHGLTPVIHYSFRNRTGSINALRKMKEFFPDVNRMQMNDVKPLSLSFLKKASRYFKVDLPLDSESFKIVDSKGFANFLIKRDLFVLIDDSKGRGIAATVESFISKVDILQRLGIRNIGLCGGFGPDRLATYFFLKRYYRINFSIDAETHLKTQQSFDVDKIRLYLSQLLRADDPNESGIQQTRSFLQNTKRSVLEDVEINGCHFVVKRAVFHPGHFPSTAWFARELAGIIQQESDFCEIGCGSGVISCLLSLSHPDLKITATDINHAAAENTEINAIAHGLSHKIEVYQGDVLESIPEGRTFDAIFWALPFGFLDPGIEIPLEEMQVFDPGYKAIRKLFKVARNYLKPGGRLLLGFSRDLGNYDLLKVLAGENQIVLKILRTVQLQEENVITFEILEGTLQK